MIEPTRIDTQEHGNGGAEAARVKARFWAEDRERMAQLDRLIRHHLDPEERETCLAGHPLDGVKNWKGRTHRYCKTCNRERMRAAREAA